MATIVESLTRDIVDRDLRKEGANLIKKWEKTGLLEGLSDDRVKNTMSVLLENQAKELLREASSMSAGDVEGFAAVAFPAALIVPPVLMFAPVTLPDALNKPVMYSPEGANTATLAVPPTVIAMLPLATGTFNSVVPFSNLLAEPTLELAVTPVRPAPLPIKK